MPVYTMKVEGPDAALTEAAEAVLGVIWPVLDLLSNRLDHPWEVYLRPLRHDPGFVRVEPGALHFDFHGFDGEIGFYDEVCRRWFALAVAAVPDRVAEALSRFEVFPVGIPALQEVLEEPRGRVLRYGSALVEVDAYGAEVRLMSDGIYEEVDGTQAEEARAFVASGRTEDPVEGFLRPSDSIRAGFLSQVPEAEGEVLQSLAWYIGLQAFPGPLAGALLDRAEDAPGPIGRAFQRLGGRADIESIVVEGLSDPRPGVRRAALLAVAPLVRRGRVSASDAVGWLLEALERSEGEREVAAEALGQVDPGEARERVVEALCALAGSEPEVEHGAALALFNLHSRGGASNAVRGFFAKVALGGGPAKGLADLALRVL